MRKLPSEFNPHANTSFDSRKHESAIKHVMGEAQYLDDVPEWPKQLHVATGYSTIASGKIEKLDLKAVKKFPGVIDVVSFEDIPGDADISPVFTGDLLLSDGTIEYIGQPLFAVAATSLRAAKQAVQLAEVEYLQNEAVLHPKTALDKELFVLPTHTLVQGDAKSEIENAPLSIEGEFYIKGQEHFYLEGQISIATPTEDGGVTIYASSQHPAEVQKLAAQVLGIPLSQVVVETRRMGGGFGGKESQAAALSCLCALFAVRNKCAVKYRMPRQDDMVQTGKRHDFWNKYKVGFNEQGEILGVDFDMVGKCGCTADLSDGVVDRAMFHADNAYFYPSARISGYRAKTHTVSNTAFRGFGGPKGVLLAESLIDEIACKLGMDPLDVRKINCYQDGKSVTPYGQTIDENVLPSLIQQLEDESHYRQRREDIKEFNSSNDYLKKGIALTPVKFGISFTSKHLNQGTALVHVYTDGSIHVSHAGTEMGQGLYTKVAQIVAKGFGVDYQRVQVSATRTDKTANGSPTAASAGTDLNGMAALNAVEQILARLSEFAAEHFKIDKADFAIENDQVKVGDTAISFPEFVKLAYFNRINLSANGFYKTPKIGYDRAQAKGRPFFYFANGAAVSEVIVDSMTGEYKVTRVDILHDVGNSLNEAIDIGQIEGGFVQGMGWLTTEELCWDDSGRIISNSPANYKIPTSSDVPKHFKVSLYDRPNSEDSVYRSKAVGEPPVMLASSVWCALRDACSSVSDYKWAPPLGAPATPEQVLMSIEAAKKYCETEND